MTTEQLTEAIEVQISLGQMMPAEFSRQCIDAIAKLLALYQSQQAIPATKLG
jgi:hypothetical protein